MAQDKIQLVGANNEPVYSKQIAQAAKGNDVSAVQEDEEEAPSPDVKQSKTKLVSFECF